MSGKTFACSLGTAQLLGNGFGADHNDDDAATGWHRTTAPVASEAEFTIRFAVWDIGDSVVTSTVVLDDFEWLTDANVAVGTTFDP